MALVTVGSVSCWFKSFCKKHRSSQENLLLLDGLLDLFDIPHDRKLQSRRLLERVCIFSELESCEAIFSGVSTPVMWWGND
jgi:hypothetical protein